MQVQPDELIPGERYFLKWGTKGISNIKPHKNIVDFFIILECEFIKHFDNQYFDARLEFRNTHIPVDTLIENNIIDQQGEFIPRDFDDPLFPYRSDKFFYKPHRRDVGLFRIIRIVSTAYYGIVSNEARGFKNNKIDQNPYGPNFINKHTKINTGDIIMGETLIWVDLSRVKIIKQIDKQKLYEDKTVDKLVSQNMNILEEDFTAKAIKPFLGGRRRKSRKTRKTRKTRKNKGITRSRRYRGGWLQQPDKTVLPVSGS
jgi:hypothetical protein